MIPPMGGRKSECLAIQLTRNPNPKINSMPRKKSHADVWGAATATNLAMLGIAPSIRQPDRAKAKRASAAITGSLRLGNALPGVGKLIGFAFPTCTLGPSTRALGQLFFFLFYQ